MSPEELATQHIDALIAERDAALLEAEGWAGEANGLRAELTELRASIRALADEWDAEQPIGMDGRRWTSQYSTRLRDVLDRSGQ